jgi:hypothetical protein
MQNLNKENFWNEVHAKYPDACQHFCKWIDDYKAEVGWDKIFAPGVKFHDVPIEIQNGILARYELEVHNNQYGTGKKVYQHIIQAYPAQVKKFFIDLQSNIVNRMKKLN